AKCVVGMAARDFNAASLAKREAQTELGQLQRQSRSPRAVDTEAVEAAKQEVLTADAGFQSPRRWMSLHMLLGAAAALMTVLVNSITVTYFIGTSAWCKEVCQTYA